MTYVIDEELTFMKPEFTIKDESGRDVFRVEGRAVRLLENLRVMDTQGNLVAGVRQTKAMKQTYEIEKDGGVVATVQPKRKLLKLRFLVSDVISGQQIVADGNFSGKEYVLQSGGVEVGRVTKQRKFLRNSYALDVGANQDHVMLLSTVLVIDAVNKEMERRREEERKRQRDQQQRDFNSRVRGF